MSGSVPDRFNGSRGAAPVAIDDYPGAAWVMDRTVMVAFAFHVEDGLGQEIELIADPEVLATMEIARHRRPGRARGVPHPRT